jgi:hypothetical protein
MTSGVNTPSLLAALQLIAGDSCANYTTGLGTCIKHPWPAEGLALRRRTLVRPMHRP